MGSSIEANLARSAERSDRERRSRRSGSRRASNSGAARSSSVVFAFHVGPNRATSKARTRSDQATISGAFSREDALLLFKEIDGDFERLRRRKRAKSSAANAKIKR